MTSFLRREWSSVLLWSITALLLWYALAVDRARLIEAVTFVAIGLIYEFIHRVVGNNKEDRP